jgi:hypothetical protein
MLGRYPLNVSALVALFFSLFTSLTHAQGTFPEHHSFKVGGWALNMLHEPDGEVIGYWGIPLEPLAVGNIRRLWFKALPDAEWDVYALEPKDAQAKAMELMDAGMSVESLVFMQSQERAAKAEDPDYLTDGGTSGLVNKGFIDGDPLTEAVGLLSDPEPMIDLLAQVSYPIAPGMTELLVSGTAGVNVNMNQATKDLLNCLGASMSISCAACICDETRDTTTGPWTVIGTILPGGGVRCEYSRTVTHSYWQVGEYPDDCTECTTGTPDEPEIFTEIEEQTVIWNGPGGCPDYPLE